MASREFLEDGTEGPFHPYRSFATRAIRADVESPHGQEDEFRLVASSDFARFALPESGISVCRAFRRDAYGGGGGGSGGSGGGGGGSGRPRRLPKATARRANAVGIPTAAIEE